MQLCVLLCFNDFETLIICSTIFKSHYCIRRGIEITVLCRCSVSLARWHCLIEWTYIHYWCVVHQYTCTQAGVWASKIHISKLVCGLPSILYQCPYSVNTCLWCTVLLEDLTWLLFSPAQYS